jgi:hypothetical protein
LDGILKSFKAIRGTIDYGSNPENKLRFWKCTAENDDRPGTTGKLDPYCRDEVNRRVSRSFIADKKQPGSHWRTRRRVKAIVDDCPKDRSGDVHRIMKNKRLMALDLGALVLVQVSGE